MSRKRSLRRARKARNRQREKELLELRSPPLRRDSRTFEGVHRGGTKLSLVFSGRPVPVKEDEPLPSEGS